MPARQGYGLLFGGVLFLEKNCTLLRSTILKRVVFDKIENITLLKGVVVRYNKKSTFLEVIIV